MIKILLSFVLVSFGMDLYSQKDTTFILRNTGEYYHAIFIDDANSEFYNTIINHTKNDIDSFVFHENINELRKKYPKGFPKHKFGDFERDWVPIYLYKGKYHVYAPSEWGFNNWVSITDSFLIEYSFDDCADPAVIRSFTKKDNSYLSLNIDKSCTPGSAINITVIDPKNQIAIFEYPGYKESFRYRLMVSANKVRSFPIIVNYCEVQKQYEMEFDKVDYIQLIRNASK